VIDTALRDVDDIAILKDAGDMALPIDDLPAARNLLDTLRSEIRIRACHLPPTTYPAALQSAARLLDQKRAGEAGAVL
jgi:hypothetical protein